MNIIRSSLEDVGRFPVAQVAYYEPSDHKDHIKQELGVSPLCVSIADEIIVSLNIFSRDSDLVD